VFTNHFIQKACFAAFFCSFVALPVIAQTQQSLGQNLPHLAAKQPVKSQNYESSQKYSKFSMLSKTTANTAKSDPTRPRNTVFDNKQAEQQDQAGLSLTAIFKRNNEYYAVINAQVVKKNEMIANKRVLLITETNLILEDANSSEEAMVLELFGSNNIKTQVQK